MKSPHLHGKVAKPPGYEKSDAMCARNRTIISQARGIFSSWVVRTHARWLVKRGTQDCHLVPQVDYVSPKFLFSSQAVRHSAAEVLSTTGGDGGSEMGCNIVLRQENLTHEVRELMRWAEDHGLLPPVPFQSAEFGTEVHGSNELHGWFCSQVQDARALLTPHAAACANEMVGADAEMFRYPRLAGGDEVAMRKHGTSNTAQAQALCECADSAVWGGTSTCGEHENANYPWCYVAEKDGCVVVGHELDQHNRSAKGAWNPCNTRRLPT